MLHGASAYRWRDKYQRSKKLIDSYYESAKSRSEIEDDRTEEADKVSACIAEKGITETTIYLERYFRSMLLGEEYTFRNRELHIDWEKPAKDTASVQSANPTLNLPPKCKSCTLEEIAVIRTVQSNPDATQKEIAAEIGKSERTVKTITVKLQEKEILRRVGGKRNGKWEIIG